jgi:hypothetical protein
VTLVLCIIAIAAAATKVANASYLVNWHKIRSQPGYSRDLHTKNAGLFLHVSEFVCNISH